MGIVDLMAGLRALLQQEDAEAPPANPPAPTEPTPAVTYPPEPATPGTPPVEATPPAGITQQWIGAIEAQAMATAAAEQAAAAVRAEFARASQPTAPVTPPTETGNIWQRMTNDPKNVTSAEINKAWADGSFHGAYNQTQGNRTEVRV